MNEPIIELIAQRIVQQLATIKIANAYMVDVPAGGSFRLTRTDIMTPERHNLVLIQGDRTREETSDYEGNPPAVAWRQQFAVAGFVMPSDSDTTPYDQLCNRLAADIERAVMLDPQWGDGSGEALAFDTELQGSGPLEDDGTPLGVLVSFDVLYRVAENDPAIKR